jgi:hypothetical protein
MEPTKTETAAPKSNPEADARFYLIVSLLLGVMVAGFAWMWWSQRSQRVAAQKQVMHLGAQLQQVQMTNQFRGMIPQFDDAKPAATKLNRKAAPTVTLPFNGGDHPVIVISPTQGTDLGLLAGDLLWVSPPSTHPPAKTE